MKSSSAPPFALPGRYEYDNETIAGGQGAVYVCRDLNLDRRVAIKTLHTASKSTTLFKEIEARAKIRSKHVAEIYDVLLSRSGKPFAIVLEYVPGVALDTPDSLPPDLNAKLLLLYQLGSGLAEIHAAGVIHRDIKPQNMKLDPAGILKIFDLGISNLDADAASTVGGAGTDVYRAPELYATKPLIVTRAADVYAFGVVAWYVLVGKFPNALLELPPLRSGSSPPSLQTVVPELGSVAKTLDRALNAIPNNRPSAAAIRDELERRITRGNQRGVFTHDERIWELTGIGRSVTVSFAPLGSITVVYEGDSFVVRRRTGDVYVNNAPASPGDVLPESCVLTFGDPSLQSRRRFVSFNASQPEIVL